MNKAFLLSVLIFFCVFGFFLILPLEVFAHPGHSTFDHHMTIGTSGESVATLQKFLNGKGFTIATSGSGSPGLESTYFGPATESALARFQQARGITPATGYFGQKTRDIILAEGGGSLSFGITPNQGSNLSNSPLSNQTLLVSLQNQLNALLQEYTRLTGKSYTTPTTKATTTKTTTTRRGGGGGGGGGGSSSSNNRVPSNTTSPSISGTAVVGSELICGSGTWSNIPTSFSYTWKRGSSSISGATNTSYIVRTEDVSQSVKCTVTASNSAGSASADSSTRTPTGTTFVTPPQNSALPSISGTTVTGNILTCSQGTWNNSPTSFSFVWKRAGTNITGATVSTYTLQAVDVGQGVTCAVTAFNSAGSATANSSPVTPTAVVTVVIPSNSALPVISGTMVTGNTLTCSQGTWNNSPTSFSFVWKRASVAISGATNSTYTLVADDVGQAITCTVTATNSAGVASATSNPITPTTPVVVQNPPVLQTAPVISGNSTTGSTLSCTQGTWSNTPTSFNYVWKRGGNNISSAMTPSYTLQQADEGQQINCTVTATNSAGPASGNSSPILASAAPASVNISEFAEGKIIPVFLNPSQSKLIFPRKTAGEGSEEPHVMDLGTGAVTLLKDIEPGSQGSNFGQPDSMALAVGRTADNSKKSYLIFRACTSALGCRVWRTDGTPGGTVPQIDWPSYAGNDPSQFTSASGIVYYSATNPAHGTELWSTSAPNLYQGSPEGGSNPVEVNLLNFATASANPTNINGFSAFVTFGADNGTTGNEPYIYNNHSGGLIHMGNINPGGASSYPKSFVIPSNPKIYFSAIDGPGGYKPYVDTEIDDYNFPANQVALGGNIPGNNNNTYNLAPIKDPATGVVSGVYMTVFNIDTGLSSLWKALGTSQAVKITDLAVKPIENKFTYANGKYIFVATASNGSTELWTSDGTQAGTFKLNVAPEGSNADVSDLYQVNVTNQSMKVVFFATTPGAGREVWSTDGTQGGTIMLRDLVLNSGSSHPKFMANFYEFYPNYPEHPVTAVYFGALDNTDGTLKLAVYSTGGMPENTLKVATYPYTGTASNNNNAAKNVASVFKQLQVYLNSNGFLVAPEGPGSPGQETEVFGEKTRDALRKWQASVGLPATGFFGEMSKNLLNGILNIR